MIYIKANDRLDFIKIKNVCSAKTTVKRMKRQATVQQKTLAKHMFEKLFVSRIYKELTTLNSKKINNQTMNGQKVGTDTH